MEYTVKKVDNQNLMFAVTTTHNNKEITFNVVCAADESEIPELIANHLNFIENPPSPPLVNQEEKKDLQSLVQEQQSIIESLTARIAALEAQ